MRRYNRGWKYESTRHSLAAQGIPTGSKQRNAEFMKEFEANIKATEQKNLQAAEELKQQLLNDKDAVEAYEFEGSVIQIFADDNPESPRDFDNLGHMVAFHKRYDLGDKDATEKSENYEGWDALREHLVKDKDAAVILPLFLLDHSGITMRTSDFHDPWDSGQVGYIYASKADIKKEYGSLTKANIEKARKVLQQEVETYDDYLTGNVYGYRVTNLKTGKEDSVWGFFGDTKYVKSEAESVAKSFNVRRKTR